jgi:hypothetical protein
MSISIKVKRRLSHESLPDWRKLMERALDVT